MKKEVGVNVDYLSRTGNEIQDYISRSVSSGTKPEDIRKGLEKAGWAGPVVDAMLNNLKEEDLVQKKGGRKKLRVSSKKDLIIQCINVKKNFGQHEVLKNINIEIKEKEIFGIIGLSGSGKTTFLNTMIGFLKLDKGDIVYKTNDNKVYSVFDKKSEVKSAFGLASQNPSFYKKLTVKENLQYFGALHSLNKKSVENNIHTLLRILNLNEGENTLAENLSGGMQKRLGIACALIHNPKVLILDEPTANLDPLLRRDMYKLIKRINEHGMTIIIASHLLSELEDLCSRISILHEGMIIESGSPEHLRNKYSKTEQVHVDLLSGNYDALLQKLKSSQMGSLIHHIIHKEHKIIIYTNKSEQLLPSLISIIKKSDDRLVELEVRRPNLTEVFEHLVIDRK